MNDPQDPDRVPQDADHREPDPEEIPLGQRLYDSPFLLLIAGIVVMFVFFTGWGVLEIMSLEQAPLP
jgi:hypothetical protein